MSTGDWIGLISLLVMTVIPLVAAFIRWSNTITRLTVALGDLDRRMQLLEARALHPSGRAS